MKKILVAAILLNISSIYSMKNVSKNFKKLSFKSMYATNNSTKKFNWKKFLGYSTLTASIGGSVGWLGYEIYLEDQKYKADLKSISNARYIPTIDEKIDYLVKVISENYIHPDLCDFLDPKKDLSSFLEHNFSQLDIAHLNKLCNALAKNSTFLDAFKQGISAHYTNQGISLEKATFAVEQILLQFSFIKN